MIGYAHSVEPNGFLSDIIIEISDAKSPYLLDESSVVKKYGINRFNGKVKTLINNQTDTCVDDDIIQKILILLRCEELKQGSGVDIIWSSNEYGKVYLQKVSIIENEFIITDIFKRNDKINLLNITGILSHKTLKPLEVTFICDILNLTLSILPVEVAAPFIGYGNNVFITFEMVKIVKHTFGFNLLNYVFDKNLSRVDKDILKSLSNEPYYKISRKKAAKLISNVKFDKDPIIGIGFRDFGAKVKTECVKSIIGSISETLNKNYGFMYLVRRIYLHIKNALLNYRILSELFVAKGHIYSLNDINYLTYYKLLESFSFAQNELNMKQEINFEKQKYKVIKNLKSPNVILTKNNNLIYK